MNKAQVTVTLDDKTTVRIPEATFDIIRQDANVPVEWGYRWCPQPIRLTTRKIREETQWYINVSQSRKFVGLSNDVKEKLTDAIKLAVGNALGKQTPVFFCNEVVEILAVPVVITSQKRYKSLLHTLETLVARRGEDALREYDTYTLEYKIINNIITVQQLMTAFGDEALRIVEFTYGRGSLQHLIINDLMKQNKVTPKRVGNPTSQMATLKM
tara:strand:+ start:149 stop:787 length:639 start_codon:yes stop_codon:yes gene_type:complete